MNMPARSHGERLWSVDGFNIEAAVSDAFHYRLGRVDLRPWRLEDGILSGLRPCGECRAAVFEVGVFGKDHQALPFSQLADELAVPIRQFACLPRHLLDVQSWHGVLVVALGLGHGLGFGGAQRGPWLGRVAAARFGIGRHGQLPLIAGGAFPVGPVLQSRGERGLAFLVGVVQGLVAGGQSLAPHGLLAFAVALGVVGFGGGADRGQAGAPGASALWFQSQGERNSLAPGEDRESPETPSELEPVSGFEPLTVRLQGGCSAC